MKVSFLSDCLLSLFSLSVDPSEYCNSSGRSRLRLVVPFRVSVLYTGFMGVASGCGKGVWHVVATVMCTHLLRCPVRKLSSTHQSIPPSLCQNLPPTGM